MSPFMDKMRLIKEATNIKYIADDIAFMVVDDLKDAGFKAKLVKPNPKRTSTWRIQPEEELSPEDLEKFNKIKDESTERWKEDHKIRLKNLKKDILRV